MKEMKAFPRADGKFYSSRTDEQGMDLRDWFAGMAMAQTSSFIKVHDVREVAKVSYLLADAMMKAREQ